MATKLITIIVPTWNNPQYLFHCVKSIIGTGILNGFADLIIVNNGKEEVEKTYGDLPNVKVISNKENLGWEGALKQGVSESSTPFLVFQNDDTFIPYANQMFYERLLFNFNDKNVGVVGPSTTTAAGIQSIWNPQAPRSYQYVRWMIFFTAMVRREALEKVGGVDDTLPGGDDIDLCIRMRKAGYKCMVSPDAFIIHEGFVTGNRVRGGANKSFGWNSKEMSDATNKALIAKHGFKEFFSTVAYQVIPKDDALASDPESDIIKSMIKGSDVLELACGSKRLYKDSITVDIAPCGTQVKDAEKRISVADITADVTKPLPLDKQFDTIIASHILEHCIDPIRTIYNWKSNLKSTGRLIIAVPDENVTAGIPMNPEHCHAFNQRSLKSLLNMLDMKQVFSQSSGNGVSFVSVFERLRSASTVIPTVTKIGGVTVA